MTVNLGIHLTETEDLGWGSSFAFVGFSSQDDRDLQFLNEVSE